MVETLDILLKYLALITVFGTAVASLLGLYKYLDQRKRDEKTKRYELFHDLMRIVSAFGPQGTDVALTQQLAGIYELQHFPEYAFAIIPILERSRKMFKEEALLVAIDVTIDKMRPLVST